MTHTEPDFDDAPTPGPVGAVTFVGAVPGDFGLVTFAAAKVISQADLLVLDNPEDADALAQAGIRFTADVVQVDVDEATQLIEAVEAGHKVVRLYRRELFGNPTVESTLSAVLDEQRIRTHLIPGLSRWESALLHGAIAPTASMGVLDTAQGVPEADAWPRAETVVIWSSAHNNAEVLEKGAEVFGPDAEVLRLSDLGTTLQRSDLTTWGKLRATDEDVCLVVGPGTSDPNRRRLAWFENKPLFDWKVLIPRTKDATDQLTEALARYGASSEIVATMSIEPPRTEQAMERAVRGIVDGRYLWLVFTSPHAVEGIIERLDEFGLDSRALSGLLLASVGRGTTEALALHGLKPDLEPSGENTAAGLAGEFPAYDDLMDPLNRVLVPSADVSVTPLLESMERLGWEAEEVTAYRTVRAAPPPAEVRERIKDGQFDAVVFTSSTAVRNMIGIAGKPHGASIIAAIGPATASACEMHGLRVDVVAEAPNVELLAEGLARFADQRRAVLLEQGLPDTKPSQRKRRRRRRASASA